MLHKVFYVPMRNDHLLSDDVIHQVFANLEKMIEIHVNLNEQMKAMKASGTLIGDVGDMLLSRFGGENGLVFKLAAAEFNRNQTRGLEALKNSQIKNSRLIKFLEEAMGNPLCRRLMLKDIIPTGMQRLTKYPLLLENLVKYTPSRFNLTESLIIFGTFSVEIIS
jgi:Rho guanine nucleotide exchange factor 12